MKRLARTLMLGCIALLCSAHIGSPDAWFDGAAGPYHVLVHVKAPAVVPGIAEINVKVDEAVDTISAFVNKYDAIEGGPPPDVAMPVDGAAGWYRTQLWVMDPGSNSVTVSVHGVRGAGKAVIPLVAVAARRLEFNGVLTAALGAAAAVLVAGLLTLIGAAVREAILPPGLTPDEAQRKRARLAMFRGAAVIVAVVSGLGVWWRAEDAAFAQSLFKPLTATARTEFVEGTGNRLMFTITDSVWTARNRTQRALVRGGNEFTTLVEDHGKLMHMFVVAENGGTSFAHLHPNTVDSISFNTILPPLPAGKYRVYADILHATGFAQTMMSSINIEAPRAAATNVVDVRLSDSDDAWIDSTTTTGAIAALADGSALTWLGADKPHVTGEEASLRFALSAPAGEPTTLEPYLGMSGHAVVIRDDGAVFIHLHPMGTISVAAQLLLSHGTSAAHTMPMATASVDTSSNGATESDNSLRFPYAFPTSGHYTIWVQIKRNGRVLTGAWHTTVIDAAKR